MIPLRDINPTSRTPVVVIALIAVNALAFFSELSLNERQLTRFVYEYGVVPVFYFGDPERFGLPDKSTYLSLLTSMFLHGGFMHLLGNMWFLWIFGDNIEDRLGRVRFLIFYLLSGLGATAVHILFNLDSPVPTIGASGAIAGVLGAYIVTFPRARILTLFPFIFIMTTIEIPAIFVIGEWFVVQLFRGTASIVEPKAMGGVAWWAHIGGFVVGILLMKLMQPPRRPSRGYDDPDYSEERRWYR